MLFDLRSGARRRTVKFVYLGLALLMFVGFVGFGIGSSGLSGSIGDLIRDQSTGGGGDNAAVDRLNTQVANAAAKTKATPSDPAAWAALAQARVRLAADGDNFDPASSDYTAAGRQQLTAASNAWDKYLALKPANVDERLARQMTQVYVSLNKPDKAVTAQEAVVEIEPTEQTYSNLAILAYQAGQIRKGDLASGKAVDLAPKDKQKDLKSQLDQAKSQAVGQQIQNLPTATATASATATPKSK
jgi:tetratricopeptide (TPR) repeat protein